MAPLLPFLARASRLFQMSNASFVLHAEEHYLADMFETVSCNDLVHLLAIILKILQGPHNFDH